MLIRLEVDHFKKWSIENNTFRTLQMFDHFKNYKYNVHRLRWTQQIGLLPMYGSS